MSPCPVECYREGRASFRWLGWVSVDLTDGRRTYQVFARLMKRSVQPVVERACFEGVGELAASYAIIDKVKGLWVRAAVERRQAEVPWLCRALRRDANGKRSEVANEGCRALSRVLEVESVPACH